MRARVSSQVLSHGRLDRDPHVIAPVSLPSLGGLGQVAFRLRCHPHADRFGFQFYGVLHVCVPQCTTGYSGASSEFPDFSQAAMAACEFHVIPSRPWPESVSRCPLPEGGRGKTGRWRSRPWKESAMAELGEGAGGSHDGVLVSHSLFPVSPDRRGRGAVAYWPTIGR